MPPIFGLYAAGVPLLVYTVFGTSRELAVGMFETYLPCSVNVTCMPD